MHLQPSCCYACSFTFHLTPFGLFVRLDIASCCLLSPASHWTFTYHWCLLFVDEKMKEITGLHWTLVVTSEWSAFTTKDLQILKRAPDWKSETQWELWSSRRRGSGHQACPTTAAYIYFKSTTFTLTQHRSTVVLCHASKTPSSILVAVNHWEWSLNVWSVDPTPSSHKMNFFLSVPPLQTLALISVHVLQHPTYATLCKTNILHPPIHSIATSQTAGLRKKNKGLFQCPILCKLWAPCGQSGSPDTPSWSNLPFPL
jgi:hypothetical protein